MKKLFLVSALALFGAMNAQTSKGSWVLSGKAGLGFNSAIQKYKANGTTVDGPKVSILTITPSVGYFVMDNLAIGLDLNYTSTRTTVKINELDLDYDSTNSTLSLLPNATYYFPTGSNFRPYLGAGIGIGSTKAMNPLTDEESTASGLLWGAKGGFVYLLNNSVGLDFGLSYNNLTTSETIQNIKVTTTTGNFGVNAGISVFFGGK